MAGPDFLTELHTAAKDAKQFFSPAGKNWLTAVFIGLKDHRDPDKLDIDRIYELFCYFSLLNALTKKPGLKARYIPGGGASGYRFPHSPGDKQNFAFFRITFEGKVYDLCCGTGVPSPLEGGKSLEHPDITLQVILSESAPATPGAIAAIWDAKHHAGKKLSKGDLAQMHMWSSLLKLPQCTTGDVLERMCPMAFQVSAIVTNVKESPQYPKLLLGGRFSIVLGFEKADMSGASPSPSRADHVAHNVTVPTTAVQLPSTPASAGSSVS